MTDVWWPTGLSALLALALAGMAAAQDEGPVAGMGDWWRVREGKPMARCAAGSAEVLRDIHGGEGAWRCVVEPSLGTTAAGLRFRTSEDLTQGLTCALGRFGGDFLGFRLLRGNEVLWADDYAPWRSYEPYVLEGVVARGRVRVQMLQWDGRTLVSQSPWVEAPDGEGFLGYYSEGGGARFWGWELAPEPLCQPTENAPNKRRLVQGPDSEWTLLGTGNWMWTDAQKVRVRQYATTDRAWAIDRGVRGAEREWRCRVRVSPGTGGAGMAFQVDQEAKNGLLCWLGGTWGAGCLMLYRLPGEALWGGAEDTWHYDTDYELVATTEPGRVRVQLLDPAQGTVLAESPWVDIPKEESAREGFIGFHTWVGPAEFWGFSEGTSIAAGGGTQPAGGSQAAAALGAAWLGLGEGKWEWLDAQQQRLGQTAAGARTSVLSRDLTGTQGLYRCRVTVPEGTGAAGLLFQADPDLQRGFAVVLSREGQAPSARLEDLSGRTLWEDKEHAWTPGTAYVLEGYVETDRVRCRALAADGTTALAESPACYVTATNNERRGHLGFTTRGGPAEFAEWSVH